MKSPSGLAAQQPFSHIPFCSSDSAARAVVDQVRFRFPLETGAVELVVDDSLCISASSALAGSGASRGIPAPFPVVVVRAGDRLVVRLPWDGRPAHSEPRTVIFDLSFHRLGEFGPEP